MNDLNVKLKLARERLAVLYDIDRLPDGQPLPDGGFSKNREVVAVARAFLEMFADLKPVVYETIQAKKFSLEKRWGIDPEPLFNLNSPRVIASGIRKLFGADVADLQVDYQLALAYLEHLYNDRILGKSTASKMAYLKPITGCAFKYITPARLQAHFPDIVRDTLELLSRQAKRLRRQGRAHTHIDRLVGALTDLLVRYRLKKTFERHPLFKTDPDLFCRVYADEIAQLVGDHFSSSHAHGKAVPATFRFVRKSGIEVTFTPRDRHFVRSGDYYGDCTAGEVRSQVDPEIANIHWTVYAWLLDPHYRVLEVLFNGRRVIKGHILPLIVHGRRVLMLDAIETIPSIRDFLRGKPNRNKSEQIYARREELLQALFAAVEKLALKIGVSAVYVDKYSNTRWVRAAVGQLPADSYHTSEVIKPFENNLIAAVVQKILKVEQKDVLEEIQARNIGLMDQQLRPNYKEVGVLMGRRKNYFIAVRGI